MMNVFGRFVVRSVTLITFLTNVSCTPSTPHGPWYIEEYHIYPATSSSGTQDAEEDDKRVSGPYVNHASCLESLGHDDPITLEDGDRFCEQSDS